MTLKKLEDAHTFTKVAHQGLVDYIDELKAKEAARIDAEYAEKLAAAKQRRETTGARVDAEKSRLALAGEGAPWPVGTRLAKRKLIHSGYYNRVAAPRYNILFGILEAVTSATAFPTNTAYYSLPPIGKYIVRICTKDGTPGKKFELLTEHEQSQWKPVEAAS